MLTEQMKADGWIEHDGGPCPIKADELTFVMLRNGWISNGPAIAGMLRWKPISRGKYNYRSLRRNDIIAYRPEPSQ